MLRQCNRSFSALLIFRRSTKKPESGSTELTKISQKVGETQNGVVPQPQLTLGLDYHKDLRCDKVQLNQTKCERNSECNMAEYKVVPQLRLGLGLGSLTKDGKTRFDRALSCDKKVNTTKVDPVKSDPKVRQARESL